MRHSHSFMNSLLGASSHINKCGAALSPLCPFLQIMILYHMVEGGNSPSTNSGKGASLLKPRRPSPWGAFSEAFMGDFRASPQKPPTRCLMGLTEALFLPGNARWRWPHPRNLDTRPRVGLRFLGVACQPQLLEKFGEMNVASRSARCRAKRRVLWWTR